MAAAASRNDFREHWKIKDETAWAEFLSEHQLSKEKVDETFKEFHLASLEFGHIDSKIPIIIKRKVQFIEPPTLLFDDGQVSVFMPVNLRVPNQVTVVLNKNIDDIEEVGTEDLITLRQMVNRVRLIMKDHLSLPDAVESINFSQKYFFAEDIIPCRIDTQDVLDSVDSVDCMGQILYNQEFAYTYTCPTESERHAQIRHWKLFLESVEDPEFSTNKTNEPIKPWTLVRTKKTQASRILLDRLYTQATKAGIEIEREKLAFTEDDQDQDTSLKKTCHFCLDHVITAQKIHETSFSYLLFHHKPESDHHFVIAPKRHVRSITNLRDEEIIDMDVLTIKLVQAMKASFPTEDVIAYIQDGPSVGQSAPHVHKHILTRPSPLRHTFRLLNGDKEPSLSPEEMQQKIPPLSPKGCRD